MLTRLPFARWLLLMVALAPAWFGPGLRPVGAEEEVIELGQRRELFVDRFLISSIKNVRLQLHPPCRTEVALRFDKPWEGDTSAYVTVLKDGPRYRMYYRASGEQGGRSWELTCVAESHDGRRWHKPELELHAFGPHRKTNIILAVPPRQGTHNFAPFVDRNPEARPQARYKALAGLPLRAWGSPDGIHWKPLAEKPVITQGAFDSQNVSFWDPNRRCYVAYFRVFRNGVRAVATATSKDFLHWSEPQPVDMQQRRGEHFYTNATLLYYRAPHLYFAFPKRFHPGRRRLPKHPHRGISDGVFLTSRDGLHFHREFPQALLRPGRDRRNWGDRSNMFAWGLVPTGPEEMSLYYSRHYRSSTAHIERAAYRVDGLASLQAGAEPGYIVTRPVRFAGRRLLLNYSTSAFGSVQVEVLSPEGKPLPGYELKAAPVLYGDAVDEPYPLYRGKRDFGPLVGKVVRLRFVLKEADLYSFRFAD